MPDREIRKLQAETRRAYVVAERLAHELDDTVQALLEHINSVATTPRRPAVRKERA